MTAAQLPPLPRRVALSAGRSLITWATRPEPRTARAAPAGRHAAIRQHRVDRLVQSERANAVSVAIRLQRPL